MPMSGANHLRKGGCIILLDVPPGSSITLDGVTRVTPSSAPSAASSSSSSSSLMSDASAPFHRGMWIISGVCSTSSDNDGGFHLIVVRSGVSKDATSTNTNNGGDCRTLPVGFVLGSPATSDSTAILSSAADSGHDWIFARRYDPRTEEISNESVDGLTLKNMVMAMGESGELGKFVISYDQFMGSTGSTTTTSNNQSSVKSSGLPSWEKRTSLINSHYLHRRHGLSHGDKIVPSSDNGSQISGDTNTTKNTSTATTSNHLQNNDGTSISYPPIPCIDQSVNARQLAQHSGTRVYLSKLSPEKRTKLLFGGGDTTDNMMNSGEYVWKDVLSQQYGRNDDNVSKGENDFLADVELSFLLFLFLECHASLEHWRDAVSMCSLSTAADATTNNIVMQHPQFFQKLLSILHCQLACIETEFFQEVEYSAGENNFMIMALRRMCNACENVGKRKRDGDAILDSLKSASQKLRQLVHDRFGLDLTAAPKDNDDNDMEIDALAIDVGDEDGHGDNTCSSEVYGNYKDDSDDEEDGPVIVPFDQVEASIARSSSRASRGPKQQPGGYHQTHNQEYPLLYAAMSPDEDEVMACARILDEKKDVSLVREAAAYLEQVEAHRGSTF